MGMALRDRMTVSSATREGARAAASAGSIGNADCRSSRPRRVPRRTSRVKPWPRSCSTVECLRRDGTGAAITHGARLRSRVALMCQRSGRLRCVTSGPKSGVREARRDVRGATPAPPSAVLTAGWRGMGRRRLTVNPRHSESRGTGHPGYRIPDAGEEARHHPWVARTVDTFDHFGVGCTQSSCFSQATSTDN